MIIRPLVGALGGLIAIILVLAASVSTPSAAAVQTTPQGGEPIIIGQSYTLTSKILGGARRLAVYLPEHYGESVRSFPVIFLLDGGEHEDFHHITGLAQINAAYGNGQEVIVVGIEGVDRRHDLTSPTSVAHDLKLAPTSGGAAEYRRFLVEEVLPWTKAHLKTTGKTALMGESLAGLFTAETLLHSPNAFDDYIIISPSLWWDGGALSREAAADLKIHDFAGRRVWIAFDRPAPPASLADLERTQQNLFEMAFKTVNPSGLWWRIERPDEGHATIYHPAAMDAFRAFYGPAQ